jgi:hypothetical protein
MISPAGRSENRAYSQNQRYIIRLFNFPVFLDLDLYEFNASKTRSRQHSHFLEKPNSAISEKEC